MMALRRMVMAQMAKGAEVIKGTFTTPDESTYTLSFGKTFQKYLYIIEMTDASKTMLMSSGINNQRTYAISGSVYPTPVINNSAPTHGYMTLRINPSTQQIQNIAAQELNTINGSSITLNNYAVDSAANNARYALIRGYSYNYTIVSLDNV